MATNKPRLSISMDEETYKKVLAYKEEKRIATQSKAIIKIMEIGLEQLEKESENKNSSPYSDEAYKLAADYDGLDQHGKRIVRLVADEEKPRCKAKADFMEMADSQYDIEQEPDTQVSSAKESGAV